MGKDLRTGRGRSHSPMSRENTAYSLGIGSIFLVPLLVSSSNITVNISPNGLLQFLNFACSLERSEVSILGLSMLLELDSIIKSVKYY